MRQLGTRFAFRKEAKGIEVHTSDWVRRYPRTFGLLSFLLGYLTINLFFRFRPLVRLSIRKPHSYV